MSGYRRWHLLFGAAVLAGGSMASYAQSDPVVGPEHHKIYGVSDWRGDATAKAVEFKAYRTIVLTNPTYSDDEKAAKIAAKYIAIEKAERKERKAVYAAVSRTVKIGNSCTNQGSSPKKCNAKCIGEPMPAMYTSLEWTQGWWGGDVEPENLKPDANKMGDDRVVADTHVCAGALKQSGHGRKTSYAEGAFRIRPARIDQMVSEEMVPIMQIVSTTPI